MLQEEIIEDAIIRNQKPIIRIDGKTFRKGTLFRIILTHDLCNTFVCEALGTRDGNVRIAHDSRHLRHFDVVNL